MRTIWIALGLAMLVACETSRAENLSEENLKALLADGLKLNLGGPGEGYTGKVCLDPDGTGFGLAVLDDGRILDITGTWEIEGDRFCRKWAFDGNKRKCEIWRKAGPNRVDVLVDGERIGVNSW